MSAKTKSRIVGVDVGGTFTDLFCFDEADRSFRTEKVPSNRGNEDVGFIEGLKRLGDLDLRLLRHAGPLQKDRQGSDVVRAEDDIDPGGLREDRALVLLRQAASDRDLHPGP